jgi:hypothetical protein
MRSFAIRDLSLKLLDHPCQLGARPPRIFRDKIGERLFNRARSS